MDFIKTCLAVLAGLLLGFVIHTPHSVKAAAFSPVYIKKATVGLNPDGIASGKEVVGFSCTGTGDDAECYIAYH